MKKLLILSASTGSGHTKAGEALVESAKQDYPDLEVSHIDVLDYVSSPVKHAIFHSYDIMIKQVPELWSFLYKRSDNPRLMRKLRSLTKRLNSFNASKLYDFIEQEKPDYILATHFYGAQLVFAAPKKRHKPPVGIVMTDYEKHAFLHMPGLDHYFVSTPRMAWKFHALGVPKKDITISGIPVLPVFTKASTDTKVKLGLPNKKTILLLSGGQGMANITELCNSIIDSGKDLSLVAIAGKSKRLERSLKELKPTKNTNLTVLGWTDKMPAYIAAADIVVTKPGGLTTSECIAMKKPILATSPIPGQEEHNAEYILENQYGNILHSMEDLLYFIHLSPEDIAPGYSRLKTKQPAAQVILKTVKKLLMDN